MLLTVKFLKSFFYVFALCFPAVNNIQLDPIPRCYLNDLRSIHRPSRPFSPPSTFTRFPLSFAPSLMAVLDDVKEPGLQDDHFVLSTLEYLFETCGTPYLKKIIIF